MLMGIKKGLKTPLNLDSFFLMSIYVEFILFQKSPNLSEEFKVWVLSFFLFEEIGSFFNWQIIQWS